MLPKTTEQVTAEFRAKPGIDILKLTPGLRIIVETTQMVYEMDVTHPNIGYVRLFSTDARLRNGVTGELLESTYDIKGTVSLPRWIGKELRMQFRFHNGIYSCSPAVTARVSGPDWYVDVF